MIVLVGLCVLIAYNILSSLKNPNIPKLTHGILDLEGEDLSKLGVISLNGEWEFYWKKLINDHDVSATITPDGYIKVPGYWHNYEIDKKSLPGVGYATYRLKVINGQVGQQLGLKIQPLSSAYRVYINEKIVAENGVVSTNKTGYKPAVVTFDSLEGTFDIIVQVSNVSFPRGGFWFPIHLGSAEMIHKMEMNNTQIEMMVMGGILIIMLYHAFIYFFLRKDLSTFYSILFSLVGIVYMLISGEVYLTQFFPHLSFEVVMFLLYFTYYWYSVLFAGFIKQLFPDEANTKVHYGMVVGAFVATFCTLFFPNYAYRFIIQFYDFLMIASIIYIFYVLVVAVRKRRQGAVSMMIAFLAVFIAAINDILYERAIYLTSFGEAFPIGIFILILCQSFLLAKRFSQNFLQVQEFSMQLLSLDKVKDEFLFNTSHELKMPLYGIMNLTKIVSDSEQNTLSESSMKNLDFIINMTKRLSSLIDDITDLQQIKENSIKMNIQTFDCRGAIQLVLDILKYTAEEKGLRMFNNIPLGTFYVKADKNRLVQIVFNLIDNAIKYTENGRIVIDAFTSNEMVHITFQDTGIGMTDDKKKHVSVYFQDDSSPHQKFDTFRGLGLYISCKLARFMEGNLCIKWTEVGGGSCFELVLPVGKYLQDSLSYSESYFKEKDKHYNEEQLKLDSMEAIQSDSSKVACTILIVEDEPTNLWVLKEILKEKNYQTRFVQTGEQALRLIQNHKDIGLVLLNVMLSDISGYEVCRKIREQYELFELPIVLVTIRNTHEEIQEGLEAGANDFIAKPFVKNELYTKIHTHLELKQSLRRALDMEILFLQSQIKPHFIYNSISVITQLCFIDGKKAGELLIQFGNYLRKTFDVDYRNREVLLEYEISLIRSYIEIEKVRFGKRVTVVFDLDEDVMSCKISPLILQPLVENAIKHGILKRIQGGTVSIRAKRIHNNLQLCVEDDGIGMSAEKLSDILNLEAKGASVGVRNINKRLLSCYNRELEIKSEINKGTIAILNIPIN